MEPKDIEKLAQTLDISKEQIAAEIGPHWWPRRGLGPMPPDDPVLYRLFEVVSCTPSLCHGFTDQAIQGVLVYGHAIKVTSSVQLALIGNADFFLEAIIHEKVGQTSDMVPFTR